MLNTVSGGLLLMVNKTHVGLLSSVTERRLPYRQILMMSQPSVAGRPREQN